MWKSKGKTVEELSMLTGCSKEIMEEFPGKR